MVLAQTQYGSECPLGRFQIDGAAPGSYNNDPVEACLACNLADLGQRRFDPEKICQCPPGTTYAQYKQLMSEYLSVEPEPTRPGFLKFVRERGVRAR